MWSHQLAWVASILLGAAVEALPQSIHMTHVSSFLTTDRAEDVQVAGKYAYLAEAVSDPASGASPPRPDCAQRGRTAALGG
jgi:hypothetical protein